MCGIFGIISKPGRFQPTTVKKALDSISHRGPDDSGIQRYQIENNWEIWLGQRRLSILDLSKAGRQPMSHSAIDNSEIDAAIVFNGEIYNHQELRNRYKDKWKYHSRTDTESLLSGLFLEDSKMLSYTNGMFAFGFLNLKKREFTLGRDRVGKKPLYVYTGPDLIVFASELKPIVELGLPLDYDEESLAYYRWLGYIPAEKSIYKQCKKFPAASSAVISLRDSKISKLVPTLFWNPLQGYEKTFKGSYEEAKECFQSLLDDATKIRLEADVPVGVFLSGGIDSSLVIASVAKQTDRRVSGFTVKFDDSEFDESSIAIDTAKKLGVNLELLKLSQSDFDRQLSKISFNYDEPFSDSSQIPTMAISEAARRYVKVVLTGDGGDEVFLGYPRYSNQARLQQVYNIPGLRQAVLAISNSSLGRHILFRAMTFSGMAGVKANFESKIMRLASLLSLRDVRQIYETIMCVQQRSWLDPMSKEIIGQLTLDQHIRKWYPDYSWDCLNNRSLEEQAAALDLVTYMRDDVLVKVDRATMAYGLEARSPLLDYRIIEFGCSLPKEYKLYRGTHKRILRDVLATRVQGDILKLGKRGFGVPLPQNLPEAPTPYAQWNRFIEQQWRESRLSTP